jgi:CRP/FNR family transcriptional regulator, anaerobic regulatory protein
MVTITTFGEPEEKAMLATATYEPRPTFVPLQGKTQNCRSCPARNRTVCAAATPDTLDRLARLAGSQQLMAGDTLIEEGDEATHLYTITSGSMKIYKLLPDGRRQVTGFLFQGDFLGLSFSDSYTYSAEALTDATVCRFARRQFDRFVENHPVIERRLLVMVSNELAAAQDQMVLLGRKTAQERVTSFLLGLIRRQERLGRDGKAIRLTMTRSDIADYLGLTTETVSRTFTALRNDGIIDLDGTTLVRVLDHHQLEAIAEIASQATSLTNPNHMPIVRTQIMAPQPRP